MPAKHAVEGSGPFIPDVALPAERQKTRNPEHALVYGIFEGAVDDMRHLNPRIAAEAQYWIFDCAREDWGSFGWCCEHLGFSRSWVRRSLIGDLRRRGLPVWSKPERAAAERARRVRVQLVTRAGRPYGRPETPTPLAAADPDPALVNLARALHVVALCALYERTRNIAIAHAIRTESALWPPSTVPLSPARVPSGRVGLDPAPAVAQGSLP
jgi:hypothetical protein